MSFALFTLNSAFSISEQLAAQVLGYTQASWDNLSGKEQQPWSSIQFWASLTKHEKSAAALLGYTQTNWDNELGTQPRPASAFKSWSEMTECGDGKDLGPCLSTAHLLPSTEP